MRSLSIVILSYNTRGITETAITKARKSARFCQKKLDNDIEIIVVDNNSTDGSKEMLQKKRSIQVVQLDKNTGATIGYNAGMKVAKNDYMLIMNNDTYLNEDTIYNSFMWLKKHPEVGAVVGKTFNGDGVRSSFGGYLPTPLKTLRWLFGFESLPVKMDRIYDTRLPEKDVQFEWIATFYLFMKREVYDTTQGHDENMFFYMEDVEFCKRIKDAGYTIWFTPQVSLVHLGGKSSKDQQKMQFLLQSQINGMLYYHKKHYPNTYELIRNTTFIGMRLRGFVFKMIGSDMAHAYQNVTI